MERQKEPREPLQEQMKKICKDMKQEEEKIAKNPSEYKVVGVQRDGQILYDIMSFDDATNGLPELKV